MSNKEIFGVMWEKGGATEEDPMAAVGKYYR
jgi:hypothetical protein